MTTPAAARLAAAVCVLEAVGDDDAGDVTEGLRCYLNVSVDDLGDALGLADPWKTETEA